MGQSIEDNRTNDLQVLLGNEEPNTLEESDDEGTDTGEDSDGSEDLSESEDESDSEETDSETDESEDNEEDEESTETEDEDEDSDNLDEKAGADFPDRPTYRQLKEYDPKLLKKFPGLRSLFFREKEFTKLYPTVEDAQEAYNDLTRLKAGEQRISTGDPEDFLDTLNSYDPLKERKFITEFLPTLQKRNQNAFIAITEPVLKKALLAMHSDAKRNGNENLVASALNAHEWLFGDDKIDEPAKIDKARATTPQNDPEKEALRKQNEQILTERQREFNNGILNESKVRINSRIEKLLGDDPKLTKYLRNSITRDTVDELAKVLRDDTAHRSNMERLQRAASKNNYSAESKDSIKSALLSRAMIALPIILKKVKADALKGTVLTPRKEIHKRPNGGNAGVPNRKTRLNEDKAKAVKSLKMSELDYLNSD